MDVSNVQTESQRQQGQGDQPRLALRGGGMIADWLVLNATAFFPSYSLPSCSFPPLFLCGSVPLCSTLYTFSLPPKLLWKPHLQFPQVVSTKMCRTNTINKQIVARPSSVLSAARTVVKIVVNLHTATPTLRFALSPIAVVGHSIMLRRRILG
jgi:hypothetical protein